MAYVDHKTETTSRVSETLARLAAFEGRAGLGTFRWLAPTFVGAMATIGALFGLGALPGQFAVAFAALTAIGLASLTVRRLHDVGCAGWPVVAQAVVIAAMGAAGAAIHGHSVSVWLGEGLLGGLAVLAFGLSILIWRRATRPGSPEPNRYGPPVR